MKTDLKSIDVMIASIAKRGKALRTDSHACLLAILDHHAEHGDFTRLPKLIAAVRNSLGSSLSAAMIVYAARFYDGLAHDPDNNSGKATKDMEYFVHLKVKGEIRKVTADDKVRVKGAAEGTYFIGDARELPFYEMEREVTQQEFDLAKAFEALLKRAKAAQEANIKKQAHNLVNAAQIAELEKIAKSIGDIKPEETAPTPQQVGANRTDATENKPVEPAATPAPRRQHKATHPAHANAA